MRYEIMDIEDLNVEADLVLDEEAFTRYELYRDSLLSEDLDPNNMFLLLSNYIWDTEQFNQPTGF